jgi:hypothetical protein
MASKGRHDITSLFIERHDAGKHDTLIASFLSLNSGARYYGVCARSRRCLRALRGSGSARVWVVSNQKHKIRLFNELRGYDLNQIRQHLHET